MSEDKDYLPSLIMGLLFGLGMILGAFIGHNIAQGTGALIGAEIAALTVYITGFAIYRQKYCSVLENHPLIVLTIVGACTGTILGTVTEEGFSTEVGALVGGIIGMISGIGIGAIDQTGSYTIKK